MHKHSISSSTEYYVREDVKNLLSADNAQKSKDLFADSRGFYGAFCWHLGDKGAEIPPLSQKVAFSDIFILHEKFKHIKLRNIYPKSINIIFRLWTVLKNKSSEQFENSRHV